MAHRTVLIDRWALTLLTLSLAACGSVGDAQVGGSVSGLAASQSVTLQNNGSDALSLSANQAFAFLTRLASGATYSVTVMTQPTGQNCTVANASGTVNGVADDVSNVAVSCVTTATLAGDLSGLASGTSVTLMNSGAMLPLAVNGPFSFAGALAKGTAYNVTVLTQPVGQTCTVANGSGVVDLAVPVKITVICS